MSKVGGDIRKFLKPSGDKKRSREEDDIESDFIPYQKKVKKSETNTSSKNQVQTAVDNPVDTENVEKSSPTRISQKKTSSKKKGTSTKKTTSIKKTSSSEEKEISPKKESSPKKKTTSPKKTSPMKTSSPKKKTASPKKTSPKKDEKMEIEQFPPTSMELENENITPEPRVSLIWADKYSPKSSSELIANPGPIKELKTWLNNWSWNEQKGKPLKKACLLSGPPGIGKTTAALVVAKEAGYTPIHLNASDQRSKITLQNKISTMLKNRGLSEFMGGKGKHEKTILIMDEIDGMSVGDKGGLAELNQMIKTTRIPIICLCNDKYKVRTLANSANVLHLPFRRPTVAQMASRISKILSLEGVKMDSDTLNKVIASTNGDVRQVFHTLQFMNAKDDKLVGSKMTEYLNATNKDIDLGPFDVAPKLLSYNKDTNSKSLTERLEYFFVDYSMMPLFIHENYLRVTPSETKKGMNKIESDLKKYADAADSISEGDIISRTIYSDQNFEILPVYGVISSIRPTSLISGFVGNRIEFPVILGKISTINKRKRLLNEVKYEIHRTTMGSTSKSLALERFNLMYDKLVDPLIEEGKDGIDEVINFMRTYNLSQEGRDNIIELCEYGGQKGKYKSNKVDSQVKRAFTRKFNTSSILPVIRRTAKKIVEENMDEEELEEEELQEDPLKDPMIKQKLKKSKSEITAKKTRKKASTTKSSSNLV